MNYKSKITKAEIVGKEVVVHASFMEGKRTVKKIIHAFPRKMTEKQIRGEVEKSLKLFVSEKKQMKEQKKVDDVNKKDNKLISNLIDK